MLLITNLAILVGQAVLVVGFTIWGLWKLLAAVDRRQPDAAWRATGVKRMTASHYDEAQAVSRARDARQMTATGRRYRVHNKLKKKPKVTAPTPVVPFNRRAQ